MKHLGKGLAALACAVLVSAGAVAAGHAAQGAGAHQVAEAAARALGGVDKVRTVRNITAIGYGQYAYMMGGGRISGSAKAPEKYMAANEMRRVYDVEHDRFQMLERRNMLFPFLDTFGHSFALNDNRLDGDVAYDITTGGGFGPPTPPRAVRQARWSENALLLDGVHMRRMWMLNNPVVLVHTMLDPASKLGAPRKEGAWTVVDLTTKYGDKLSAGFEAGGLPAFVRFANPQTNLGQVNLTTWFTGWVDTDGLLMPLGYQTRSDWRDVDFFKMYVDAYQVNAKIDDLAAPAETKAAAEPVSYPSPAPLRSVQAGPGVWRISTGTTAIEFKDHVTLFELGVNSRSAAKAVIDYARELGHGKPVTELIVSHNHFDHTAGLREAVAQGLTVIGRPTSLQQFREMAAHPAPDFPDDLQKTKAPFKTRVLNEHLQLKDETQTVDIYWGRNNGHMADVTFAYIPSQKLMIEGDLVTAAFTWQHWADTFRDVIAYYKLDVERISPVHSVWREHPDILTHAQAEEILSGGVKRAREHCADYVSKGVYAPGCPVQSKYY